MHNSDVVLKTGYFAKIKQYQDAGFTPVSIARTAPRFVKGALPYPYLAPTKELFQGWKKGYYNEFDYKDIFERDVLNHVPQHDVLSDLLELTKSKKIVLLCWEKSGSFCHRHLVSDWFKKGGYECEEFYLS